MQTKPDFATLQQAAQWFATLSDEKATDAERQQWMQWRDASPQHEAAWQRVEAINQQFTELPAQNRTTAKQILDNVASNRLPRRKALKTLALLFSAGLASWLTVRHQPWQGMLASHRTSIGEQKQFALEDGSSLWLNTGSRVDVRYSAQLRRIVLLEGEILIQTHADTHMPARPLVVDTQHGRMQAMGTRFNVRQRDGFTDLLVLEGAVQVQPVEPGTSAQLVQAGEQARFDAQSILTLGPAEAASHAWQKGVLQAENMRLEDFVAELSRYRRGYLACDPAIADLRIVGTYNLQDVDAVLALVQKTLPVKVRQVLPWWTEVVPR